MEEKQYTWFTTCHRCGKKEEMKFGAYVDSSTVKKAFSDSGWIVGGEIDESGRMSHWTCRDCKGMLQ